MKNYHNKKMIHKNMKYHDISMNQDEHLSTYDWKPIIKICQDTKKNKVSTGWNIITPEILGLTINHNLLPKKLLPSTCTNDRFCTFSNLKYFGAANVITRRSIALDTISGTHFWIGLFCFRVLWLPIIFHDTWFSCKASMIKVSISSIIITFDRGMRIIGCFYKITFRISFIWFHVITMSFLVR